MEPDATPHPHNRTSLYRTLTWREQPAAVYGCNRSWVSVGEGYDGPRAGSALAVGVGRAGFLFPLRVVWGARGSGPPRAAGSPPSAVMGRAGGTAGLPVRAMALDDGSDVLSGDAVQVQVRLSARLGRAGAGGWGPAGHMAVFCNAAPGCRPVWYRPRHEHEASA
jgi:hypothetical protein